MIHSFRNQIPEMISFPKILTMLDILHLVRLCGWWRYEPRRRIMYLCNSNPDLSPHLETLFCPVAPVAVLAAEGFLSVRLVPAGEDVGLEVTLRGGDMNTLRTVPALAAPSHFHVSHRVIVLPGAQRVELVAGAEQPLHHDGIGRGGVGVVLAQELHQSW